MAQQAEGWSRSAKAAAWTHTPPQWHLKGPRKFTRLNTERKRNECIFKKNTSLLSEERACALSISWINHIVCACSGQTLAVSAPSASPAGSFLKRAHQWDAMMSFPHCQYGLRAVGNAFDPLRLCTSIPALPHRNTHLLSSSFFKGPKYKQ